MEEYNLGFELGARLGLAGTIAGHTLCIIGNNACFIWVSN